ncbi:MAG: hypothetical protein MK132_23190 [Lentisphaerales bacterium]|nr:hypothetical protein [Lentisphaerales bacterium]
MRLLASIILALFWVSNHSFAESKVDKSIEKAVSFLLKQQKADGGIYEHNYKTTMTSLAIMSLASLGHMPDDDTKEGKAIRRALDFVLQDKHQDPSGKLANPTTGVCMVMASSLLC